MGERCKTVNEVAEMLGVTAPTVYKLLREGTLQRVVNSKPPSKLGGRPKTFVSICSVVSYLKNN